MTKYRLTPLKIPRLRLERTVAQMFSLALTMKLVGSKKLSEKII